MRRQHGDIYRPDDGSKEHRHQTVASVFILTLFANQCVFISIELHVSIIMLPAVKLLSE